jgi:alpha-N-arabinofuranosidase
MKEVDASVILVGSGDLDSVSTGIDSTKKRGWTEGMLQDCADNMDLISEHFYRGRTPWTDTGRTDVLNHVRQIADAIREKATRHRELQASMPHLEGRFIPIAMDEWNYWHREYVYGDLGCIYELQDALGIANGFHEYYRNGDIIPMAHYAQTVNVIGAIKTTKTAAEFDTTGLVLKLYRNHYGTLPLLLEEDYGNYGVAAALNDTGSLLTVSVVNPTQEPIDVSLLIDGVTLLGGGTRWHITGPEATSFNVPGKPRVVDLHETRLQGKSPRLEVPALSCALFELPIEQEKN